MIFIKRKFGDKICVLSQQRNMLPYVFPTSFYAPWKKEIPFLPSRRFWPKKHIKIKRKIVMNGVAVRADNIPMIRIDMEFRDESFGDIPGVQGSHIWGKKNRWHKKHRKFYKKVIRPRTGSGIDENQHKLVQSTQNFETDRTVTVPWAKTLIFEKLKFSPKSSKKQKKEKRPHKFF